MRRRALLALLPALAAGRPAAAQEMVAARPLAVVDTDVIRLSDLFENAGPRGDTALGSAPAPGRRMVVEAPQLAAIARLYGLAWRPIGPNERVVVERPGRPVGREEIQEAVRSELQQLGMDADSEIELPGLIPPMVPVAAQVQITCEGSYFDAASQRFATTLVIMADGMPALRARIAGRALPTMPVAVATRRLLLGDVVGPGDVQVVQMRAERVRPGTAQRLQDVVGRQLRRPIGSNTPFATADLGAPNLVARFEPVTLQLEAPGLSLAAVGRALDSGALGEVVAVMNLGSRLVVEGVVTGPGRVRVAPGAPPIQRALPAHLAALAPR
ncbi:MAG TPA: flagellar basal body P-ring formation chaperone FlgA [Roseomonas sp.]|jgi:flagella basal body P-ring formation protein FlgA